MPVIYTNCEGRKYYLHQGVTKKGNPRYWFSLNAEGGLAEHIPEGYEVFEEPNGKVFLRRIRIPLVTDDELKIISRSIPKDVNHKLVVKERTVTVYTAEELSGLYEMFGVRRFGPYQEMMRFILADEGTRTFRAERYCFRGSIDGWVYLKGPGPLAELAGKCCVHLGRDSFYELPYLDGF